MNYRFENIDDAKKELSKLIKQLEKQSKVLSDHLHQVGNKNEGVEQVFKFENEIMKAISGKAKLLPVKSEHQLIRTYRKMLLHVVSSIEDNQITDKTVDEYQYTLNKIAELSFRFGVIFKDSKSKFTLFENLRNIIRNIVGILLGDKYIDLAQMTVPAFHITYDFKTRDRDNITDKGYIKQFVLDVIDELGMKVLHGPNMMEGSKKNPGVTAFTVIDFSHIAIHTFVLPHNLENEVFMDIFSCKPYDKDKVIKMIEKHFNVEKNKVNLEVLSFGE